MKYYRTNTLIIEYPILFLGNQVQARRSWKVAWTGLTSDEKTRFIPKGMLLGGKLGEWGRRSTQNLILLNLHITKEEFLDAISRYFSNLLNVNSSKLSFQFKEPHPFGDLNEP